MYGKLEARIKFCNKNGSFPAFWTLGDSFEFGYKENSSPAPVMPHNVPDFGLE